MPISTRNWSRTVRVGSATRRGARRAGPFPRGLPPNRTGQFPGIRLSSDYCVSAAFGCLWWIRSWQAPQTTRVLRRRLVIACAHGGCGRPGMARLAIDADVVDLHLARLLAELAPVHKEPADQLLVWIDRPGQTVGQDRHFLPPQRYPSEPCDQFPPVVTRHAGLKAGAWPMRCRDFGFEPGRHLRHRRAVLARQGLEHGCLHDPAQPVQAPDVPGQQVVLDDAPVLGPELGDDGVVGLVHQGISARGFAARQVGGTLGLDHRFGDPQRGLSADRAAATGQLLLVVLNGDLVAEEPSRARSGVGEQRLVRRQFQLEVITKERRQPRLDLLGFGLRSGEPEQGVIRVAHVPQPPVARIARVLAGQTAQPPAQRPHLGAVTAPAGSCDRMLHLTVGRIACPAFPSGVLRDQHRLDEDVQPVQIDVGQDRGSDTTLRRAAERGAPDPVLQVSGRQHVAHQPQEPVVVDARRQRLRA